MPNLEASRWVMQKSPKYETKAGIAAAFTTSMYGTFTYSAIMNAAAPMMGGINCPSVLAATSVAAAFFGG